MVRVLRMIPAALAAMFLLAATAGCQQQQQTSGAGFGWKPLFGDLAKDATPVIAQVGDIEITQADLELFIDEQPDRSKGQFAGPEGERVALRRMVEQALMVTGAVERKLYNDQVVARSLVMQRRLTLDRAMRQYGLLRDAAPTEEQMREFYDKNIGRYKQQGMVRVRHIECASKADADRAFRRLQAKSPVDDWVKICEEFSLNEKTKKLSGDAGWMSDGTVVPLVESGAEFSKAVFNLPIGVSPPMQIGGKWHIVDVTHREFERNSSFTESKDMIRNEMLPGFQDGIIKDYLKGSPRQVRREADGPLHARTGHDAAAAVRARHAQPGHHAPDRHPHDDRRRLPRFRSCR
jgi:peptidyl-prolyl cis-trans isomerase C